MQRLIATFDLTVEHVVAVARSEQDRSGASLAVTVQEVQLAHRSGLCCRVVGRAQDVMFLIGAIAASGEDALVSAERA